MEAKCLSHNLRISAKDSVRISRTIKGLDLEKAKDILKKVIEKKTPIFYPKGFAHRRGKFGGGKYPVKAAEGILKVLESAEANAKFLGMEKMKVKNIIVNRGRAIYTPKRNSGRRLKNTEITVILSD
jgi:large subunit ribosomal protein L22